MKTTIKTALLSAVTALGLLAGTAQAATYTAGVTATSFRDPGQPGLQTRLWNLSNSGSLGYTGSTVTTSDLTNVGDSFTTDLFRIVAFDAGIDGDDVVPKPASITFDFGGLGIITLMGTTVGSSTGATAVFASGTLNIGGGLAIVVSIADTVFNSVGGAYVSGKSGATPVTATFTLAAVPLPATLPLGLLALGGLAAVARRRKSA
jgi:hypothetical protein